MADSEKKARSIDDILDSVEKADSLAKNLVRSSFAMGWDAYSKNVKITGINKETGKLILEGDVATANAAAKDVVFENILRNVYLPGTDDKAWKVILAEMNKPEHKIYKGQHFEMAFGEAGALWEDVWDNQFKDPLDNFDYTSVVGKFMDGATKRAIGAINERYVTADEIGMLVKAAEERLAADPKIDWQLTEKWEKDPGAAVSYLLSQRQAMDPVAASMMKDGYLKGTPRKKA